MAKSERQVNRTRKLLQQALIDLISEHKYDAITIQDIVDRANVGRTTFYLHYNGKDALFMSCHEAIVSGFHSHHSLSREELLSPKAPPGMTSAYQHLLTARALLIPIFQGKDSLLIQRRIRDQSAQAIEENLRTVFADTDTTMPIDLLANYLAGAQIALVQWWLEKHSPHTPEDLAQVFHRLQRAAIYDVFGLWNGE